MNIPIYQVDAFASAPFTGNPAAVCMLPTWPDDGILQSIAAENNLSETAFLVRDRPGFDLRWFSPVTEVGLCGHATLASAFVLFERLDWPSQSILFQTRQAGTLTVTQREHQLELDFPAMPVTTTTAPVDLAKALGIPVDHVFLAGDDLMVVLDDEGEVRALAPDMTALEEIVCRGVCVTAPGNDSDFVSRFFAPRYGIPEDPVTGSAHCALTPYWSKRLNKNRLHARQISARGGELFCTNAGERILISGRAVLYLEGTVSI